MKIIDGDLLNSECNHIAHCANCFHTFGAGIARQIREQYPEAYDADLNTKKGDINKLGQFTCAESSGKFIYNLYGQYSFGSGKRLMEDKLEMALVHLKNHLCTKRIDGDSNIILGFPWKIGCCLAGGNFSIVRPMVEGIFKEVGFPVYWVKYTS